MGWCASSGDGAGAGGATARFERSRALLAILHRLHGRVVRCFERLRSGLGALGADALFTLALLVVAYALSTLPQRAGRASVRALGLDARVCAALAHRGLRERWDHGASAVREIFLKIIN